MNGWLLAALVLLVAGMGPAAYLGMRDGPLDRLVGLQLAGTVGVVTLLLLAHGYGQSSYLIVPLVLAALSFAGTLVFTRLVRRQP